MIIQENSLANSFFIIGFSFPFSILSPHFLRKYMTDVNDVKPIMWPIYVHSPWFESLRDGRKHYEGRCNMGKATQMRSGDVLEIGLAKDNKRVLSELRFTRTIKRIHTFKSFEEAISTLPLERVLPGVKTLQEGLAIYHKFVSEANETAYGVLMIELENV